ncbi:hypothetical protein [Sphingopyxis flava]|uniref:hypothetical protein n=1 Tax=Sphingopyxis flava TaxID=1507287 RepID=UPI0011173D79|nr:hypothetical protein [Sphingopyxis flava]
MKSRLRLEPSVKQKTRASVKRATPQKPRKVYEKDPRADLFWNAKRRARKAGIPFTITMDDIVIPSHCPVLGIPVFRMTGSKGGGDNSPSLDKINPNLGYVKGNVIVISGRANRLKADASIKELRDIASFYATLRRGVRVTGAKEIT